MAEPRLFGIPPGADFPAAFVAGLIARHGAGPPEALARAEVFVNTRRMQRRIEAAFDAGPARLLPRLQLVTDIGARLPLPGLPPTLPPLRRRLELARLVAALLERAPELAPGTAAFDLAESLGALFDEMQGEGVPPEKLEELDVSDQSGHWQRSLTFINLVRNFLSEAGAEAIDAEARQRLAVEALIARWDKAPPEHPVIVAGSTGSRGTTARLMQAVARLPQGAVVLPGFDFDMPPHGWAALTDARSGEDHPQFRFARLCEALGMEPGAVHPWHEAATAPDPARNRTLSLVLRPAPVTDQWLSEGRDMPDPRAAMARVTLIEAPGPREEAGAIALILRDAVERGVRAALVTPDRVLTRQVTAALDRWGIIPDDSAGRPLELTAPGRFLRQTAALLVAPPPADALMALLKHPLAATGGAEGGKERGAHVLHARELELHLRRRGIPHPHGQDIRAWGEAREEHRDWAFWLAEVLEAVPAPERRPLAEHLKAHLRLAETLAAGPGQEGAGELWLKAAGIEALRQMQALEREAAHGGEVTPAEYAALIHQILAEREVRETVAADSRVMIWGTLEARAQGADLVIAAGLNEGVWPAQPGADPWLNRQMRHAVGLLLPERRIGLSAHDFQQAAGAAELVLTRALRDAEAQTVPSRWLNRLTNYLGGISDEGRAALAEMRARGNHWLALARRLDAAENRVEPARRPAPRPPVEVRPRRLSITEISHLVRDPYAIYARHVLGLRPLDPLRPQPEASQRGTVVHTIMERFLRSVGDGAPLTTGTLMDIAREVMEAEVPWPLARRLWLARLARIAGWIVEGEASRLAGAFPAALEKDCTLKLEDPRFTLTGRIDRVDLLADGTFAVYDYKTGSVPTRKQVRHFDPQLPLSALAVSRGAVEGVAPGAVTQAAYIGLGTNPKFTPIEIDAALLEEAETSLFRLVSTYLDPSTGYVSRRAMFRSAYPGDYDHLARHGEWEDSDAPEPEDVGR
ncbi:double-strand break repair protein AddB [Meinhardsimonia xiamenensis]|jgi:double-strand break repair protein AddB|uniref:Double-strand break repair protein AddB n=1 Tax=Meinhardsimonia xiamenensis TaxID=990712 RepID=A0A1G8YB45_9RHOB|nr:double-strand break repair protein AddB [Meinhardsimonia xiamenensis]PRX37212.1 double-strand break repair protein AddB [Meinhardsimonia xiamenensis]SDJ99280.1 double-strand break repair protein AddB [Meinhardsimonia xiamenensis]